MGFTRLSLGAHSTSYFHYWHITIPSDEGFRVFLLNQALEKRALLKRNFKGNPITTSFQSSDRQVSSFCLLSSRMLVRFELTKITFLKYSKLSIFKIDNSLYPPKVQIAHASYSTPYSRYHPPYVQGVSELSLNQACTSLFQQVIFKVFRTTFWVFLLK